MSDENIFEKEKEQRRKLADGYFNVDLSNQRKWYSKRASAHKKYANRLSLTVIACGAFTTFVVAIKPIMTNVNWDLVIAGLGVTVALVQGILRIWRHDETWIEYRKASELMKRERRLFVNAAGQYTGSTDEGPSYRHFVEAVEQIIAEEQQIYFKLDASPQAEKIPVQGDPGKPEDE
jgi:hypothetical protein